VDAYLQRQICERIKQARKGAGFTQEEMASLLGITQRGYQNYESERVPFRRLGEIARLTDVEQEWLLRGEQAETPGQAGLLRDVASGVEALERSSRDVLARLDESLVRLGQIEAALSPSATIRRPPRKGSHPA
jgi:transcriptional regulator with XRE-family HTH domain